MKSLIEKALSYPAKEYTKKEREGELELAIEYFNGRVTATQVRKAFGGGTTNSNYLYRMTVAVKNAIRSGKLDRLVMK